ncbi:MAG TPA: Asp-tRNA(Asn)/Glu-tRNA(Gln) amidotransferase subunit GatB [Vicinamibacterales bacterium]|nr:Asp-tRNA(Asn)/Glu-tRNA(Gln) amidotransferase subunit GatB [Vicinamibacterales bacterium]
MPPAMFESIIGLEVHAQLLTRTKIFCGCSTQFGAPPNTHVCPVCLGLPGALPVLNRRAVELAVTAALALDCTIQPLSVFARKHYFYPDLPKGYQISQYEQPLATAGGIEFATDEGPQRVGIIRVHLEEDAGKSLHEASERSATTALDFNRSGVPLIEIVTQPDLRSGAAAAQLFMRLRAILVAVGVNDGNMEEGSLRCDANVSIRPPGATALGVKTEVKNLNSFRHVQRALEYEIERQTAVLRDGGPLRQETRLWDVTAGRTVLMRVKEEADDYRYFPEPDLRPLALEAAWVDDLRQRLPELPDARRRRLAAQYHLPDYDAGVLTQSMPLADYFERTAAAAGHAKAASNWIMGEVARTMKERGIAIEAFPLAPEALAELIVLAETGAISGPVAREVFETMMATGRGARQIVDEDGLRRIDDEAALERLVEEVVRDHPGPVAQFRGGRTQTFAFLVGQVMKASRGKANPETVNALLRRALAVQEPSGD